MLLRTDRFDLTRLQESRAYDLLMRLPLLIWFLILAFVSSGSLDQYRQGADPEIPAAVYSLNIAMRLSVIAYVVIVIATVLVRTRPRGKARGLEPRISALL